MVLEFYFDPCSPASLAFARHLLGLDVEVELPLTLRPMAPSMDVAWTAVALTCLERHDRAKAADFMGLLEAYLQVDDRAPDARLLMQLATQAGLEGALCGDRLNDPAALAQVLTHRQMLEDTGLLDYPVLIAREGRRCSVLAYELEPDAIRMRIQALLEPENRLQ